MQHQPLADRTLRQIATALGALAPCSRADLCAHTGLSRATVGKAVSQLVAAGLVHETHGSSGTEGRGRRPSLLRWSEDAGLVAGIDVGHSHVTVALATIDGALVSDASADVAVDRSPHDTLVACRDLVAQALATCGREEQALVSIAVGVPAPISAPSAASAHGSVLPGWTDVDIVEAFGRLFDVPVVLENDANLGALAEQRFGPRAGSGDLLYVKISTGLGAGVICNGSLVRGQRGQAGELGHFVVDPAGRLCRCGARGCLETVAAIPSIAHDLALLHPGTRTASDIVALLDAGDPAAERAVTDAGHALGRALAPTVCLLSPAHVVVNGLGDRSDRLVDGIHRAIGELVPRAQRQDLTIRASTFGDRNEILGAVQLAIAARPLRHDLDLGGPRSSPGT